ncbi:TMEM165/GDT1 family protein [Polynucleobacter sp.]|uniref:TMEM165/GDT1 family protein n=1 Tax=Polynucleobacter sp. TaxID=2029855 RepID=UPI0027335D0C|nr:TMEM165/GDT1 family protein [Polynucleobacter sp.]MDP3121184.1 TMEM165/GDT1 family protein [Polynucleobacter sp.]
MDFSAVFLSTGVVALAEMGDKTQLLSLMLAARYPRQALPIIAGILAATLANHACAAYFGHLIAAFLSPDAMRWILGVGFLAIGFWLIIPDRLDDAGGTRVKNAAWPVFLLTTSLFFMAEMGDKTQIATIALGARYDDVIAVTIGTTLGMMLANAPAVWIGTKFTKRIPIKWVHTVAAVVFIAIGILTLLYG